jgi:hypothetical protein
VAGSCTTTTAPGTWGSRSSVAPRSPAVCITVLASATVWPKASGTSTLSTVVVVAAGGIVPAAVVAGRSALGVVRTSRPATASAARPTSTIATIATRLDATRMLPPVRLGLLQPTIPTDAVGGWMVHPYRASPRAPSVAASPHTVIPRLSARLAIRFSVGCPLIIHLIIQTIGLDPSGALWTDEAPNVSRPDPTGAIQIDAEHPSGNQKVVGSNPTSGSTNQQLKPFSDAQARVPLRP